MRLQHVWPWLVQMGYDRGGWYSWDRLDNGGRPSADRIHSEWQQIKLGDWLTAWSPGGPRDAWEVAALEAEHYLGCAGSAICAGGRSTPEGPGRAPTHWTMQTRQFANTKRLAEHDRAQARPDAV